MNIDSIASMGLKIKHASHAFTEKLPTLNFHRTQPEQQEVILEEVISRPGYDQHGRVLRKKIDDSKRKLENIRNALDRNKIKNVLFKKESEGVRSSIQSSLVLINEIAKIIDGHSHVSARNNRQTLEFIIGEMSESIININIDEEIDYSTLNKLSTVFTAFSVAIWTYLVNTNILPTDNFAGKSIPFFLNLLPLATQIIQFTAINMFKLKNGDASAIVKIYQSLLPALTDIKELLYEEEINTTLAALQRNSESIMALQLEHQKIEQGKDNDLLAALKNFSEHRPSEEEVLQSKIMDEASENVLLRHQIIKALFQKGENIKDLYKVFDSYRQKKYPHPDLSCSTASSSFTVLTV